jgi:hypothetical protein
MVALVENGAYLLDCLQQMLEQRLHLHFADWWRTIAAPAPPSASACSAALLRLPRPPLVEAASPHARSPRPLSIVTRFGRAPTRRSKTKGGRRPASIWSRSAGRSQERRCRPRFGRSKTKGSKSPHGRWKEAPPVQSVVRRSRSGCDDDGDRAHCTPPRGRARGGRIRPLSRGMHSAACNARFARFSGQQSPPPRLRGVIRGTTTQLLGGAPTSPPSDAMIGWSTGG